MEAEQGTERTEQGAFSVHWGLLTETTNTRKTTAVIPSLEAGQVIALCKTLQLPAAPRVKDEVLRKIDQSLPPSPHPSLWPHHLFCSLTSEPEFSLGVQSTRVLFPQISTPTIRLPLNLHSDVSSPGRSQHTLSTLSFLLAAYLPNTREHIFLPQKLFMLSTH